MYGRACILPFAIKHSVWKFIHDVYISKRHVFALITSLCRRGMYTFSNDLCQELTLQEDTLHILLAQTTSFNFLEPSIPHFTMSVRIKIMYGEVFSRCKVHLIEKDLLNCLTHQEFFHLVQNAVGSFTDGVNEQKVRIQYRDDEGTFVTMNDESDMKDALGCLTAAPSTDGVFRLRVRVHDEVTPVAKGFISKPHPSSSNTLTTTSEDRRSSMNNACFHFDTRDDGCETTTSRKRCLDFASRQPAQLPEKKILTPVERFIAKTEKNIEEKDKMIQGLKMEELNIKGRISAAKRGNVGNGTLCRNCHMPLGHNARNCTFDKCGSVYECGEEKLHSGEVNVKQIAQTLEKLSNEKDKLNAELESRKSAAENVHDSIINRLENSLLEADPSS